MASRRPTLGITIEQITPDVEQITPDVAKELFPQEDGRHPCESTGCPHTVPYDDEPYCFTHTPDNGSSCVPGYSYRRSHASKVNKGPRNAWVWYRRSHPAK